MLIGKIDDDNNKNKNSNHHIILLNHNNNNDNIKVNKSNKLSSSSSSLLTRNYEIMIRRSSSILFFSSILQLLINQQHYISSAFQISSSNIQIGVPQYYYNYYEDYISTSKTMSSDYHFDPRRIVSRTALLLSNNDNSVDSKRNNNDILDLDLALGDATDKLSFGGAFESKHGMLSKPYVSPMINDIDQSKFSTLFTKLEQQEQHQQQQCPKIDPLWEQVKLEAMYTLENEPSAGPQLYTLILSQPSLVKALTSIVSHEIETELIPATLLNNLFMEMLDPIEDSKAISLDIMKTSLRSSSEVDGTALNTILFHPGLHALVCHRLSHRLWLAKRTGLAYYIQSTVSRRYSSDIHPAARFGCGIYLNAGSAGVVIGETAVVDHDVTILQGVTLGGTGKERGDRHPKVRRGAILQQSCSVLGNIQIGEGAIITAKSIVTKNVPAMARVSGVPGKVKSFVKESSYNDTGIVSSSKDAKTFEAKSSSGLYGKEIFVNIDEMNDIEQLFMKAYIQFWNGSHEHISIF